MQHYGGDWQLLFRSAVVYLVPLCRILTQPYPNPKPWHGLVAFDTAHTQWCTLACCPLVRQFKLAAANAPGA